MRRNHLTIIATLVLVISCKSKTAFNYSEAIVAKEKSLESAIKETEKKVADFIRENNWDSMVAVSQRMVTQVSDKLTEIKNEPAPNAKESENFKKASVDYFEYMKGVYTTYVSYGKAATDEEKAAEMEKLQTMVAKKDVVIQKMQAAQRKYAEANGFKVQ